MKNPMAQGNPAAPDSFTAPENRALKIVLLGLSITSSWGNGHATTYRGLVRGLSLRGHQVLFLERDVPWYAANRDLPLPPFGHTELYTSIRDLKKRFTAQIRLADLVIVGSFVPEGQVIGQWITKIAQGITAFYDIDTPVTLAKLSRGETEYLSYELIPRYQLYLSFTGGPILQKLERQLGSPMARTFYCSVDPELYFPQDQALQWDLGYMGTYSPDRQPGLERLMFQVARNWTSSRMVVAGSLYPVDLSWPENVTHIEHLPPEQHRIFYNAQRFTLNLTRADMIRAGYAPSVRLFEAAACGTPIISDYWTGLETLFRLDTEILVARTTDDVWRYQHDLSEQERKAIGERARKRILAEHTPMHRADQLETYVAELNSLAKYNSVVVPKKRQQTLRGTDEAPVDSITEKASTYEIGHFWPDN